MEELNNEFVVKKGKSVEVRMKISRWELKILERIVDSLEDHEDCQECGGSESHKDLQDLKLWGALRSLKVDQKIEDLFSYQIFLKNNLDFIADYMTFKRYARCALNLMNGEYSCTEIYYWHNVIIPNPMFIYDFICDNAEVTK